MSISIAVCNNIPLRLRGRLRLIMFEPSANVFVGNLNKKQREEAFDIIEKFKENGECLFIYPFKNSQGYQFKIFGDLRKRQFILYDNINLVKINK